MPKETTIITNYNDIFVDLVTLLLLFFQFQLFGVE